LVSEFLVTLSAGTRLGPYEIVVPIGAGGMGEVYRARDTRLERTVAVKVLTPHLSSSPESRQRFEREARTISQLSHPHICALYDVGREGQTEYLVMEYLEGETLADRLLKGPLPIEQVLRYGGEIADALDKAHRQGIVHRDLKPGNVMLTKSGVKLLDFGLARALVPASAATQLTALPTQALALTQEGTLLGTLQYMAPEQLEAKEADARTDIFAFGAVLYEMATGTKAFSGTSQASLIGAILRDEPRPISDVVPLTPTSLDRVVRTCLAKDPDDRWQTAHDIGVQLRWIAEGGSQVGLPSAVATGRRNRGQLAWIVAALFAVALAASLLRGLRQPESREPIRFSIPPPEQGEFARIPEGNSLALSPDGAVLAMVVRTAGRSSLWVRRLDALQPMEVKATEGAISPFWSPDGRFIGYFAGGKLKKIAAGGGPPQTLCDSASGNGATWGRDGTILFVEWSGGREGIYRISAEGGVPVRLTLDDPSKNKGLDGWPVFLPDGRHFLYVSGAFGGKETGSIRVGSLDSPQTRPVIAVNSRVVYSLPGYLLFARDGTLLAQPFDATALRTTGDPFPISDDVWFFRATGNAAFSVSENGNLVYLGAARPSRLTWRDRSGREIGVLGAPALFARPRLSPDGLRLAVLVADPRLGTRDIWIYDSQRGLGQRFTVDPVDAVSPIWSPGGDRIAFGSGRESPIDIYVKPANVPGNEELLLHETGVQLPTDWSPDGSRILYEENAPSRSASRKLRFFSLIGKPKPTALLRTPFTETQARYAPGGEWISYVSFESSRPEVYVVPAEGQGAPLRISASGGSFPRWRRDGKELFYLASSGDIVSVPTRLIGGFHAGSPSVLFTANPPPSELDVTPDGQRFLFLEEVQGDVPLTVVVNWAAEARK
jgi:Tol biopolymer transport system component